MVLKILICFVLVFEMLALTVVMMAYEHECKAHEKTKNELWKTKNRLRLALSLLRRDDD